MVVPVVLIISEISLLAVLFDRNDTRFLQMLLFSQALLFVVAIPFLFRSETKFSPTVSKPIAILVFLLSVGSVYGSWHYIQEVVPMNYIDAGKHMLTQFGDLFFVLGVVFTAVSLIASMVLRSDR